MQRCVLRVGAWAWFRRVNDCPFGLRTRVPHESIFPWPVLPLRMPPRICELISGHPQRLGNGRAHLWRSILARGQGVDGVGVPTKIAWKPFYSSMSVPSLKGPGNFQTLPTLRRNRITHVAEAEAQEAAVVFNDEPNDEDVAYWFGVLQNKMKDRFSEVRRAFRKLDEDASGNLDRNEFRKMLEIFNLQAVRCVMCTARKHDAWAYAWALVCTCVPTFVSLVR